MARIPVGRLRTLALQGVATAVTALLIGGAAAALGQPLDAPLTAATEGPTEGVTEGPTDEPSEQVSTTEDGDSNAYGKAVSEAARGLTPPVGNCRNHGHWVSTVAKGLDSCDDNPRPANGQVDEPAQRVKPPKASKAPKRGKPAHAASPGKNMADKAKGHGRGKGKGKRP